jgi:hypothetical protein
MKLAGEQWPARITLGAGATAGGKVTAQFSIFDFDQISGLIPV